MDMETNTATKTVSFWVPGGKRAAGVARRSVLSVQAGLPGTIRHRLALLLSELVTNAIQHGGAGPEETVQVRLASSPARVRVEVFDPGSNGAAPRDRVDEGGGYGLLLVDRLADDWGREDTGSGGSLAWFELSLEHLGEG
jgi:anti-sigma regulatory factor (Ser/Thr protein kinase)